LKITQKSAQEAVLSLMHNRVRFDFDIETDGESVLLYYNGQRLPESINLTYGQEVK